MDIQSFFRKRRLDFSFSNKSRLKLKREDIAGTTFGEMLHQQTDSYKNTSLDKVIGSLKSIKNLHNLRIAAMTSAFVFFLLALDFAFPLVIRDDTVEGEGGSSTYELAVYVNSPFAALEMTPTNINGAFSRSKYDIDFLVVTNNEKGYTLTLENENNDWNLHGGDSSMDAISVDSGIDAATFDTDIFNNRWGYIPSKYNSEDNATKYYGIPIDGSIATLDQTSTSGSESYTIGLGARLTYDLAPGVYRSTPFTIKAVGNVTTYTVYYEDGGIENVNNLPESPKQVGSDNNTITLSDTIPVRDGYTFRYWCRGELNHGTPFEDGTICYGDHYQPGETFRIDPTTDETEIVFYATWGLARYNINLDLNGGTGGSVSTKATYGQKTLDAISRPTKTTTVNVGYSRGSGASDATISPNTSSSTSTASYNFTGWWFNTVKIADNSNPPRLNSYTPFTDGGGAWTYTDMTTPITLSASWSSPVYSAVTLPTIAKNGYTCEWNTRSDGSGDGYLSGSSMTPNGETRLYAVCTVEKYMQDFTVTDANNMTVGEVKALVDVRDNEVYNVKKLEDGNVWLIDNLRLDLTNVALDTLKGTTNANDTAITCLMVGCSDTVEGTFVNFEDPTYAVNKVKSVSGWTNNYNSPIINTDYKNDTASYVTGSGAGSNKIGVYYNYCAASAGSFCFNNEFVEYGGESITPEYDICPKGWTMPSGGRGIGSYFYLNSLHPGGIASVQTALSLINSGYLPGNITAYTTNFSLWAANLIKTTGGVYAKSYTDENAFYFSNRSTGGSVRCIFKGTLPTMQTVRSPIALGMVEGESMNLRDERDDKVYKVTAFANKLWMTENLAIGCRNTIGLPMKDGIELTSEDSDVVGTYTTPHSQYFETFWDSYDNGGMVCSNKYGAWYNFAAASAETVRGDSNNGPISGSICPKGWTLPTTDDLISVRDADYNITYFTPIAGSYIKANGDQDSSYTKRGYYWSSTARNSSKRGVLRYNGSGDSISVNPSETDSYRNRGYYVRCVLKNND